MWHCTTRCWRDYHKIRLYMNPYLPSRAMILSTTQMTKQSLQIFQHCCFRWKIPTWEWHVCNGKTWSTSRAPLNKPAVGCSQPPIPYHLPIPIRQGLEFDQRQFCRLIARSKIFLHDIRRGTKGLVMMWDDWMRKSMPSPWNMPNWWILLVPWFIATLFLNCDSTDDSMMMSTQHTWLILTRRLSREGVGFWCNVPGHLCGGGTTSWINGSIWKSNWSLARKHVETC